MGGQGAATEKNDDIQGRAEDFQDTWDASTACEASEYLLTFTGTLRNLSWLTG